MAANIAIQRPPWEAQQFMREEISTSSPTVQPLTWNPGTTSAPSLTLTPSSLFGVTGARVTFARQKPYFAWVGWMKLRMPSGLACHSNL